MNIPKGFFLHKGKLFKHDFKGHKGRPGKVGGSSPKGSGSGKGVPDEKKDVSNSEWVLNKKQKVPGEFGMSAKVSKNVDGYNVKLYFHDEMIESMNTDDSEGSISAAVQESVDLFREHSDRLPGT